MPLLECCQRDVATLPLQSTAYDAARLMEEKNADMVVITEDARPIGVITDRDLVVRVLTKFRNPQITPVTEIMSEDPLVLDERTGLYEAMQFGRDWNLRRFPIVDADGRLVGIITLDDIIRLLVEEISWVAHIIEKVSSPQASA